MGSFKGGAAAVSAYRDRSETLIRAFFFMFLFEINFSHAKTTYPHSEWNNQLLGHGVGLGRLLMPATCGREWVIE